MATDRPEDRDGALTELRLRSDGISVIAKAFDNNNKQVDLPAKIVFYPQFFAVYEKVRLGTIEVMSVQGTEKASVYRGAMDLLGRNGAIQMSRVEDHGTVMPFFIGKPQKPAEESAETSEV